MVKVLGFSGRLLWSAALLATVCVRSLAQAQEEEPEPAVLEQPRQVSDENDFNQWVSGRRDISFIHSLFDKRLTLTIAGIDRTCGIAPSQRKKLELAGRGDIKRFFDRVDEKRRQFELVKDKEDQLAKLQQELAPLRTLIDQRGPFGSGSIFSKTLPNVLSKQQSAQYQKALEESRRYRYQATVESEVAILDTAVGLSDEQREKLATVLMSDDRLFEKSDSDDISERFLRMVLLSEAKIRPIFDDVQWRALSRFFVELKQNAGNLPENGEDKEDDAMALEIEEGAEVKAKAGASKNDGGPRP